MSEEERITNEMMALAARIDASLHGIDLRVVVSALMALLMQSFVELLDSKDRETIRDYFEQVVIERLREGLEEEMDDQGIES